MTSTDQILKIKQFFQSDNNTLLVNGVNETIGSFYVYALEYYANLNKFKINFLKSNNKIQGNDDLFGSKRINILTITNIKKIDEITSSTEKNAMIADYKTYKKYFTKFLSVNGYKYSQDISYFIKNEFGIHDEQLILYCQSNPILLYSEISKYIINNNSYVRDQNLTDKKNHILDIRKLVISLKKEKINVKLFYDTIKNEAKYKKLNFLTY